MKLRGIEGRLLLIVVLSTLAMLVAGLAALRALDEIGAAAETVTGREVPAVTAAMRLARIGERLQQRGASLMAATTPEALSDAQAAIVTDIDAFTREAAALEATQSEPGAVSIISRELADHLNDLREALATQAALAAAVEFQQIQMLNEENRVRQLIGPSILAVEAITSNLSTSDLATYKTAVRSQGPLLSAERLTNRATAEFLLAARSNTPESLDEIRNSFSRTTTQLAGLEPVLPVGLQAEFHDAAAAFSGQLGDGGGFALRARELAERTAAEAALAASAENAARLKRAVDAQVLSAGRTMANVTETLRQTILSTTTQFWMAGLAVILIAGAVSYALVIRPLSRNLAGVTTAMTRLAGGEKDTQVPGAERRDEIGDLARAFTVFKDNTFQMEQLDRQLTERSNLLLATFDTMKDGFSVFDQDRKLVAWNPQFLALYGFDEAAVSGSPSIEEINRMLEERRVRAFLPNGGETDLDTLSHRRLVLSQRHELRFPDEKVLALRSNPIPQGGFATIHMDVSEQRQTENQLLQAQKMETVGQLTGGIAHDFNNILAVIIGNLNIIARESDDKPAVRDRADRALGAADRAAGLVSRLLAFSRRQRLAPEDVDLNALVAGMSDLLETSLGADISLETNLADALPRVRVDPGPLENALMNLAINARDAMDGEGEIRISTQSAEDGFVELSVSDTGSGIPQDLLDQVFEPFFTTKPVDKGSGLGLSMVYGFVQQSGGTVAIDSTPETGTRVGLRLPVARAAGTTAEPVETTPENPENEELIDACILVVDDDTDLLELTADQLRGHGYAIVTATDGATALELLKEIPEIDLLYTDLAMPGGISGFDLAETARERRPDLPVLFTSGAPGEAGERLKTLLRKPVQEDVLAAAVRAQLEAQRRRTSAPNI
ncbi:PAS-domain containing protein [Tropicimonas sp. TH_r6]|uniref:ATP-binding protein n=1 Tax=Tropicimonas sp. TH_r6 TaxID=3082085 RepID=UPI002953A0A7|nr:ATP-binding protein [Tropicimonas sp. TH_r6]MDV7145881.1 PAS-domain containing protein [Tropicimonas sp. TH_r6]